MAIVEHVGSNVEATQFDTPVPDGIIDITETERGLLPNTRYAIRVRAFNNLGVSSEWSEAIEFGTGTDDTIPATPTGLQLSTVDGHLTILWDEVTTNEDGTPLTDLAFYEILLQDNIEYGAGGDLLPPFRYTSIANSYTFLYSANKAIHDAVGEPPSDDWTVTVRAVDFSGNPSGDATNVQALSFGGGGSDFPVNYESVNYNGTTVEAHDATAGIKIQENGEAEFQTLRIMDDIEVNGHSAMLPPIAIFTMNESNNPAGRQTFANTNWDPIHWNNNALNNDIDGSNIVSYSVGTGIHTINASGWYRITISHRWIVDGVGARHTEVEINGATIKALGGHPGGGSLATELNNYTDIRCIDLSDGDELVFSAMQDSGSTLDLVYAQLIIEWIST